MHASGEPDQVIPADLGDHCRMIGWIEPDEQHIRIVNGLFIPDAQPERGRLLRLARKLTNTEEQRI